MSQTVAALIPAAVDYERTLVLAIELSNKNWVLAAHVPGLPQTKAKRTVNPEAEALLAAFAGYRARAVSTVCRPVPPRAKQSGGNLGGNGTIACRIVHRRFAPWAIVHERYGMERSDDRFSRS
jgi:hypothetical protein